MRNSFRIGWTFIDKIIFKSIQEDKHPDVNNLKLQKYVLKKTVMNIPVLKIRQNNNSENQNYLIKTKE